MTCFIKALCVYSPLESVKYERVLFEKAWEVNSEEDTLGFRVLSAVWGDFKSYCGFRAGCLCACFHMENWDNYRGSARLTLGKHYVVLCSLNTPPLVYLKGPRFLFGLKETWMTALYGKQQILGLGEMASSKEQDRNLTLSTCFRWLTLTWTVAPADVQHTLMALTYACAHTYTLARSRVYTQ